MNSNKSAINQLSMMLLLTIVTQVFLLIKNSILAANFGVSAELDAFNLTTNVSNFIYSFIGAGISTIIIPYLGNKSTKKTLDVFITIIYSIGLILLISMLIFREEITQLLSGQSDNIILSVASKLFIFTLITGFANSLIELARGILEYKGQFTKQKLVVLFSTIILVLMLWLGTNGDIYYYAFFVLLSSIINVTIHLYLLKKSQYKYNISFDTSNRDYKEMIRLFLPIVLSTGVYQVSLLIGTMISARLGVGSISILSYSSAVMSLINMLILRNLTSFIYPKLVKISADNECQQRSLSEYILFTNAVMCIIMVLFVTAGKEGISILYERGNFTTENTKIVYICSLIFALSLPVNGVRDIIYKYFYIKKDTYSPFMNSIIVSVINIGISLLLSRFYGLYGVVLGTVIASYLSLIFISIKLKRKFPIYSNKNILFIENAKIVIVSILTIIISMLLKNVFVIENVFIGLISYSVLTLLVFIILVLALKSKVYKINL